jgi:hypothetical protein
VLVARNGRSVSEIVCDKQIRRKYVIQLLQCLAEVRFVVRAIAIALLDKLRLSAKMSVARASAVALQSIGGHILSAKRVV